MTGKRTFVLVHGGSHGGWCWRDVAALLRARGHQVTSPTLTGLGERAHLVNESVTLDTHIEDITSHLVWEDLAQVVLVGHSYGGAVVFGAADRMPERLARLILLDAWFMADGETCMDLLPKEVVAERLRLAQETTGGLTLPIPEPAAFGVLDHAQAAWIQPRLTAQPVRTYTTPLRLRHRPGNGLPGDYIACTSPAYPVMLPLHERARQAGWPVHGLATGHDAMVSAPLETADLLERIATGSG